MGIASITDGIALVDEIRRSFFQFVSLWYSNEFLDKWVWFVNYFVSLLADIMKHRRFCLRCALVALQVIKGLFAFERFS